MIPVQWFTDRVNEKKVNINMQYTGGPEVIAAFDQFQAVRSGVIDLMFGPCSYYGPILPASNALQLSQFDPAQDRARGVHDYNVEIHKPFGVFYLGRFCFTLPNCYGMNVWLSKNPVATIADFKGLRIRSGAVHDELLKALGAIPITIAWPEVYNAATRGIIDGACGTGLEYGPQAYAEMFKYVLYPSFYDHDLVILVNQAKWNRLSKEQQQAMTDVTISIEKEVSAFMCKGYDDLRGKMKSYGMKEISLSEAESKTFLDLAYSSSWKTVERLCSPEVYAKLRQLLYKQP